MSRKISVLKFKRMVNAFVMSRDSSIDKLKPTIKEKIEDSDNSNVEQYKKLRKFESKIIKIKSVLKSLEESGKSDHYKEEIDDLRIQISLIKNQIDQLI